VLWEHFAHGLLDGTLDPRGTSTSFATGIEPEILAEMMNELEEKTGGKEESYAEVIASFVGHLEQSDSAVGSRREPMEKLSTFVSKLNPRLRRDFLNGAFASLESRPQLSEEFLTGLPEDLILETLEDINSLGSYVPPMIVTILQKLSNNATHGKRTGARALAAHPFDAATGQKLRVMFNEDDLDAYVPDSYQETLRSIALLDRLVVPELEDVEYLKETLVEHNIERQICWMLQDVMADPPDGQLSESVQQNLLELGRYFLETGDFAGLAEMYGRLKQDAQVECQSG
jgi:hypothetical protein